MSRRSRFRSIDSIAIIVLGALVATSCVLGLVAVSSISLKAAQLTGRNHLPGPEAVLGMLLAFSVLLWIGRSVTSAGGEDA